MKLACCLLPILMALVLPLAGRQVWAQPIPIVENSNPDYQGVGCVMADGSYLHVWLDRKCRWRNSCG